MTDKLPIALVSILFEFQNHPERTFGIRPPAASEADRNHVVLSEFRPEEHAPAFFGNLKFKSAISDLIRSFDTGSELLQKIRLECQGNTVLQEKEILFQILIIGGRRLEIRLHLS